MTETARLGPLGSLGPEAVLRAVGIVRDGLVVDLSVPLDAGLLPLGDPRFNEPFARRDLLTPDAYRALVDSGPRGFHLDAFGGSIHQGTHLDGLAHLVEHGAIFGGRRETDVRTPAGWSDGGVETVPPIVTRGILLDLAVDRPLPDSTEISGDAIEAALEGSGTTLGHGDAVLVRTGKIRELATNRERFLDRQPGIGLEAAVLLAERGISLYGSDTGGTEPQPIGDWERTVHAELLVHRGIHLLEWLDLDGLATQLGRRDRSDFLLVVLPLRIPGATGSWVRPIAVL
jgi:kynurenine formamidase